MCKCHSLLFILIVILTLDKVLFSVFTCAGCKNGNADFSRYLANLLNLHKSFDILYLDKYSKFFN